MDIASDLLKIKDVAEISHEVKEIRRGLDNLKSTKGLTKTKFQDLTIDSLQDMEAWLDKNNPSKNYAIITDLHVALEHVSHSITPYKATLDFLQAIRKLEIPTVNHAIHIQ